MCLYPKLIQNRKYLPNKKNGGIIPQVKDKRVLMVPVGCQKCMECKRQKSRQWSIRLQEEIRTIKQGHKHFVTLTFSNESIKKLHSEIKGIEGYELDNEIATLATRRFLERWRKKYKVSIKHWLITELGHNGTENIHLHGILFTDKPKEIEKIWQYGWVYTGKYVNEKTINYISKYVTKVDLKHKEYNAKILTSPGIGSNYTNRLDAKLNQYKPGQTDEAYTTRQGTKIALPIYYRNKIYTEEEREKLWLEKLDKNERWVDKSRVSIEHGYQEYDKLIRQARIKNKRLGYGDDQKNWQRIQYENDRRKLKLKERIENDNNNTMRTGKQQLLQNTRSRPME